jgi:hypothetical protein
MARGTERGTFPPFGYTTTEAGKLGFFACFHCCFQERNLVEFHDC